MTGLAEADVRRIVREEIAASLGGTVPDSQQHLPTVPGPGLGGYAGVDALESAPGSLELLGELKDGLREISDKQQSLTATIREVRRDLGRVAGFLADSERFASMERHTGAVVDKSHRGTPSVAGPVLDTPDDPATTVGDTTDIRPVGSGDVGQSVGRAGVPSTRPALAEDGRP